MTDLITDTFNVGKFDRDFIKKSINLVTSINQSVIINEQINQQPDTISILKDLDSQKRKYIGIKERPNTFSTIYNCHGMTFANRRTGINNSDEVKQIIEQDNYKEVHFKDLLPGDIVVYLDDLEGFSHSGIILTIPPHSEQILGNNVYVLSKWGDSFEIIHLIYNTPYGNKIKFFRCELQILKAN